MNIFNCEPFHFSEEARRILSSEGKYKEKAVSREDLLKEIETCDVLILRFGHTIDRAVIDRAARLKVIACPATGLDHIDLDYAKAKNIRVIHLTHEDGFLDQIHATAEHTWGLILSVVRKSFAAFDSVRKGEWERDRFLGHELHGKNLGILGLGRVGRKVAVYGLAFGMNVLAYDIRREQSMIGVEMADSMGALLNHSDILTIHVPAGEETHHLVGKNEIFSLPEGSYLVNTSRGSVIDENALVQALKSGHLGGAAVDVLTGERDAGFLSRNPLARYSREHDHLVITPHIGGATRDSWEKAEVHLAQKIVKICQSLT